jgi:hypothetical protein
MNARRLIPTRLRHHSRVLAVQCRTCGQWRKPRHIRIPVTVCRTCEANGLNQTWRRGTATRNTTTHEATTPASAGVATPTTPTPTPTPAVVPAVAGGGHR